MNLFSVLDKNSSEHWSLCSLFAKSCGYLLASYQDCCQTGRFYWFRLWKRSFGYLSDGHGAEDVEEDKGAVRVVLAQQVAVRQPLDVRQRHKRQLGHHPSIKAGRKREKQAKVWGCLLERTEEVTDGSTEYLYLYSGLHHPHVTLGFELKIQIFEQSVSLTWS